MSLNECESEAECEEKLAIEKEPENSETSQDSENSDDSKNKESSYPPDYGFQIGCPRDLKSGSFRTIFEPKPKI